MIINNLKNSKVENLEIIERKGIGHPDTLADGIAEELSRQFCNLSLEKYGRFLRYFFDKVIIYGGISEVEFGKGFMKEPFKVLVPAMVSSINDIDTLIKEKTIDYLKSVLHDFSEEFCKVIPIVYKTKTKFYEHEKASDTSIGSGYYPFSGTEKITLDVEKFLNSQGYKKNKPFLGEDIKVLAFRNKQKIELTLACSFISKYIFDKEDYFEKKKTVEENIKEFINKNYSKKINLDINPDDKEKVYLSFLGSCIDSFAVGISGKGNKVNGITSLFRSASQEAVFGKNIIRHPGKIYNILSFIIAKRFVECFNLKECYVHLLGKVGNEIKIPDKVVIEPLGKLNKNEALKEYSHIMDNLDTLRKFLLKQNICKNPESIFCIF